MSDQAPSSVLMIRPASFGFNIQTQESNTFQKKNHQEENGKVISMAIREFDRMVRELKDAGVRVIVFNDSPLPVKPDSVFPNNWVSFHHDGTVVLYPMMAENRRTERRADILNVLQKKYHFDLSRIVDLSEFENGRRFLEGTGSIVFDYMSGLAYASLSPRTDEQVLEVLCGETGFKPFVFHAVDRNGTPLYHTNVMMCIGTGYAVVCLESIREETERKKLAESLKKTDHEIVDISIGQMNAFAGNMIELKGRSRKRLLVMSKNAYKSLKPMQENLLTKYTSLVAADIPVIEQTGGGSVRCMIAGIFLPEFRDA